MDKTTICSTMFCYNYVDQDEYEKYLNDQSKPPFCWSCKAKKQEDQAKNEPKSENNEENVA